MKKDILILGAGCWGTTLASLYSKKGFDVTIWEPIDEFRKFLFYYRHPKFFKYIRLPSKVKITGDISEIKNFDIIMLVVPSKYLFDTLNKIKNLNIELGNKIFISCIKGFERKTLMRPTQLINYKLLVSDKNIFVFSGPSHAEEIALGKPAALTIAGKNLEILKKLQKILSTNNIRVYTNTDIIGVEIASAIKNVYAIAAGICDGLNLGSNAKAALITRSLKEMILIGKVFYAEIKTFFGLSGLGDLITTSYSNYSRNRNFGEFIVRFGSVKIAKEKILTSIEGYYTTKVIYEIANKHCLDLPIAKEVYKIIYRNKSPKKSLKSLFSRKLISEFKGYSL